MSEARGQPDPYAGLVAAASCAVGDVLDGDAGAGEAALAAIREELASETFDPYPFRPRQPDDDLPLDCGPLVRSMMGGDPEPGEGPPFTHVHRLPEAEEDEEAPYVPPVPPFTVAVRATKRGTCRHCGTAVTHGPRGWRDDGDGPLAYGCPDAPLGFHEP